MLDTIENLDELKNIDITLALLSNMNFTLEDIIRKKQLIRGSAYEYTSRPSDSERLNHKKQSIKMV